MLLTTTRRIYFYQILWTTSDKKEVMKNHAFLENILNDFYKMDINNELAYIFDKVGNTTNIKCKISKVRKTDLPLKYNLNQRKESPLNLTNEEGLYEPTHFIVFDGKIIGTEFNPHGPRITILENIINKKLRENPINNIKRVKIKPILKKDIYKIMDKVVELRKIKISIATNYALLLKNVDSRFDKLFSAAELLDNAYLEISLGFGRKRNITNSLFDLLPLLKKIFRRSDYAGNLKLLKLRGRLKESGPIEEIDLIEQLLMSEKRVTKLDERSRSVNSNSVYRAILDSYNSFKDELDGFIKEEE